MWAPVAILIKRSHIIPLALPSFPLFFRAPYVHNAAAAVVTSVAATVTARSGGDLTLHYSSFSLPIPPPMPQPLLTLLNCHVTLLPRNLSSGLWL